MIKDIIAKRVVLPLPKPAEWWLGKVEYVEFTIVKIETDSGIVGYGADYTPANIINGKIREKLIGKDPHMIEKIMRELDDILITLRSSYSPRCASVEIALWDIIGKEAKQPLYKILGGFKKRIKAYVHTSSLLSPEEHAKVALNFLEKGFKAHKIRLHRRNPEDDIRVVKAIKDAVGNEMEIMCDANQAHTLHYTETHRPWSRRTALWVARQLEKLDVVWLEEPLYKEDFEGYAELARAVDIQIAGGEGVTSLYTFKMMLECGGWDIVQPDCMFTGILLAKKIATLAEAHGKWCVPHNSGPFRTASFDLAANLHLLGAIPNGPYISIGYEPPSYPLNLPEEDLLKEYIISEDMLPLKDGYVELPDRPGLGLEINEKVLSKYVKE